MASLTHSLQPHYVRALELLPPSLALWVKQVLVDQLSILQLVIALAAGWLLFSLVFLRGKKRNLPLRKLLNPDSIHPNQGRMQQVCRTAFQP